MTNKRFIGIVVTIFLLFATVFISAGCDSSSTADNHIPNPTPTPNERFTVTFDSNGGTNVPSQTVEAGGTLTMPDNPTRYGYVFAGWFKDREFTQSFVFGENGDKVTANITLYARWIDADLLTAEYAAREIVIGYAEGDNPNYVTQNLKLPTKIRDADISWASSSAAVSSSGNVTRQADNTDVTLTATSSYNGKSSEPKIFTVKVIRRRTRDNSTIKARTIDEASIGDIRVQRNESGDVTDIEGQYVSFDIRNADDALDAVTVLRDELGIRSPDKELKTFLATSNSYGAEYSFQQVYKGVKVYGRSLMASVNASGKGDFLHSSILASIVLDNADMKINLTTSQAESIAASAYSGDVEIDTERTEQIVYSLEDYANNPVYAYVVRVYGTSGSEYIDDTVFINAETRNVIDTYKNIHTENIIGKITTNKRDELGNFEEFPVSVISELGEYPVLYDPDTRIHIYRYVDRDNVPFVHLYAADTMEVSAYTNMIKAIKWWCLSFDRDSLDDRGINISVITHYRGHENNAAWAGQKGDSGGIFIGDFYDPQIHSCAAAIDVIVHETTHAVIEYDIPGGLPYKNTTGAINEGYADIFGCIKDENWAHAEKIYRNSCDRNIADPADPDAQQNIDSNARYNYAHAPRNLSELYTGTEDNGGVHLNSSIVSYPAYLMSKKNNPSNGLTWDELAQVWYESIHMGLDAASKFEDVRRCVIWAAMKIDLSAEKLAVIKAAFDEVGITEAKFKGTVYGIVRDKTDPNKLLEGVSVTASEKKLRNGKIKSAVAGRTTTTTAGGYFIQLEAGKYTLSFDKTGYISGSADVVIQSNDSVSINKELPLAEVSLSGTIRDISDASRIAGATVGLRKGWGGYASEKLKTTTTDANGLYYFDLTQEGTGLYTVDVSKQGYKSASLEVAVGGKTAGQDLALEPVSKDIPVSDDIPTDIPVSDDIPVVVSGDIPIDAAHFPDALFRTYISEEIDIDKDGILSRTEIENTTNIDVFYYGYYGISSLQGIKYFVNLQTLICEGNHLTVLDVSGCTALRELNCLDNDLTELNASGCTALKNLDCERNELTVLNVSGCTALTTLACFDNQLITLDVSGCTALEYLSCVGNQLTTLNVSGCTALATLYCGENKLTTLDLSNCPKLNSSNVRYDDGVTIIWPSSISPTASTLNTSPSASPKSTSVSEVLAILPAFIPSTSGTYTFTVQLNRTPLEGSPLVLLADSEDLNASFAFTDSYDVVMVSANFTAGRFYAPIVVAKTDSHSQGGCSATNIGAVLLIAGAVLTSVRKS